MTQQTSQGMASPYNQAGVKFPKDLGVQSYKVKIQADFHLLNAKNAWQFWRLMSCT